MKYVHISLLVPEILPWEFFVTVDGAGGGGGIGYPCILVF